MPKAKFANAFGDAPPISAGTTLTQPADLPMVEEQLEYDYDQLDSEVRDQVIRDVRVIKQEERGLRISIITIGGKLDAIKGAVKHGQFEDICRTEFGMNERTAQNWMNVYRRFTVEQLDLFSDTNALYMLAGPSVPEEVRDNVIAQAKESGQPINRAAAREAINKHRQSTGNGGSTMPIGPNFVPATPPTVDGEATVISTTQHTTTTTTSNAPAAAPNFVPASTDHNITSDTRTVDVLEVDMEEVNEIAEEIKNLIGGELAGYLAVLEVTINQVATYYYEKTSDIYLYERARDVLKAISDKLMKSEES